MTETVRDRKGAIAWMARNPVAANLLLLLFLVGGILTSMSVKQEVFPDFELDTIAIHVPYPGATPTEVEQGIVLAIEEAVRGVDGVKEVEAVAAENQGSVYVQLELGQDPNEVLADVKNAVDAVQTLPREAEKPAVSLVVNKVEVISVIVHGDQDERSLRAVAESIRERLLTHPLIDTVEMRGARPKEIEIEVPQTNLRAYGIGLQQIADRVAAGALELSGGAVKTSGGEVLLRTAERRHHSEEFRDIPIVTTATGGQVVLGDIARVRDTFAETDESSSYGGAPAIMLRVFRSGALGPIEVAEAVKQVVRDIEPGLPAGVAIAQWIDWSQMYRERINLLLKNAYMGLMFVMVILGLLLEIRLAFWVTMGIPVSFLGTLLLMPTFDVSVNMISLFAFIVTLGMVVDDAIVVGENIYAMRSKGVPFLVASVRGAREVAVPVTFSIATTIVAFMPMFWVPGFSGKLYRVIPIIVITVLLISLFESLFMLPAHLGNMKAPGRAGWYAALHRGQQRISVALEGFITDRYAPFLWRVLHHRYLTLAVGVAILAMTVGWVAGGRIDFRYMPNIDGDAVVANVELPHGASVEQARVVQQRLVRAADRVIAANGGSTLVRGVYAQIGNTFVDDPGKARVGGPKSAHLGNVQVLMVPSTERDLVASEFARQWREEVGEIAGVESLTFKYDIGPTPGAPIDVELRHADIEVLERAAAELGLTVREYSVLRDIDDGFAQGKPQLDLTLTAQGASFGLTAGDVARQVRAAFYGAEALRQQEGRDEVKVVARLPEPERRSIHDVAELLIRTPSGGEVPLREVADIVHGHSRPNIQRSNGQRVLHVTADIVPGAGGSRDILTALQTEVLPRLAKKYHGLSYGFGGENKEQQEVMSSLLRGGQIALLGIFALLAIPFRSYVQPIVVMAAIPFGFVGAVFGHTIMGYELSIVSAMGMVALTGVVVNDSIVLIDAANALRNAGLAPLAAIWQAGPKRFRAILLTSLTTFFGLMPMITETQTQARFLIPMAISLGFGVLFSTVIVLLLVPALYLMVEDLRALWSPTKVAASSPVESPPPTEEGESDSSDQR